MSTRRFWQIVGAGVVLLVPLAFVYDLLTFVAWALSWALLMFGADAVLNVRRAVGRYIDTGELPTSGRHADGWALIDGDEPDREPSRSAHKAA